MRTWPLGERTTTEEAVTGLVQPAPPPIGSDALAALPACPFALLAYFALQTGHKQAKHLRYHGNAGDGAFAHRLEDGRALAHKAASVRLISGMLRSCTLV